MLLHNISIIKAANVCIHFWPHVALTLNKPVLALSLLTLSACLGSGKHNFKKVIGLTQAEFEFMGPDVVADSVEHWSHKWDIVGSNP